MVWWVLAIKVIGWIITTYAVVKYLTTPYDSPKASGLSDFSIPTADAARALPVVFGTVKITGANVVWYGDFGSFGFAGEGSNGKPVGYYYFLGLDAALCMGPIEVVHWATFEEKSAGNTQFFYGDGTDLEPRQGLVRICLVAVDLFGGMKSGGGVQGNIDVYLGNAAQDPSGYLQGRVSADYPGLSQVCHAVFRNVGGAGGTGEGGVPGDQYFGGFYWGTSPYLKPVAFVVERCPNTLGMPDGHHRTSFDAPGWGHDSNPACIIYEILTDTTWGLGLSSAMINTQSFLDAGELLYGEAFGMSMMMEHQGAGSEVIADILRHIDGELFADPETGQLTLRVVRALSAETIAALPVFDESILANVEFSRGSWSETYNQVKVTYCSRFDNFTPRVAQWQNLSNLQMRDEVACLQVAMEGISTAGPASQAAGRLLKGASYPFARLRLFANRQAWKLRPGDAIKVTWPALGIIEMVCRVVRPASGELTDGMISLDVVEDMFSYSGTGFSDPGPSGWIDPIGEPTAALAETLIELPYQLSGVEGVAGAADRRVGAYAVRSDNQQLGFKVAADAAGGTDYVQTNSVEGFFPTGTLIDAYAKSTAALDVSGFVVGDPVDIGRLASISAAQLYQGVNLALIDSEIIAWQTVAGTTTTRTITNVLRGVLDTVPADHAAGARVWFITDGQTACWTNPSTPYAADETIAAKLLPFTIRAVLGPASAVRETVALAGRALKPLPPGRVRVNGFAWPDAQTFTGADVVVTWAHRHRVNQATAGVVVSQDATDYAVAPEGTYTIEVRVSGALKRTVTGVTAATWTWTTAMQTADGAGGLPATIRVYPVLDALVGTYQERGFTA